MQSWSTATEPMDLSSSQQLASRSVHSDFSEPLDLTVPQRPEIPQPYMEYCQESDATRLYTHAHSNYSHKYGQRSYATPWTDHYEYESQMYDDECAPNSRKQCEYEVDHWSNRPCRYKDLYWDTERMDNCHYGLRDKYQRRSISPYWNRESVDSNRESTEYYHSRYNSYGDLNRTPDHLHRNIVKADIREGFPEDRHNGGVTHGTGGSCRYSLDGAFQKSDTHDRSIFPRHRVDITTIRSEEARKKSKGKLKSMDRKQGETEVFISNNMHFVGGVVTSNSESDKNVKPIILPDYLINHFPSPVSSSHEDSDHHRFIDDNDDEDDDDDDDDRQPRRGGGRKHERTENITGFNLKIKRELD